MGDLRALRAGAHNSKPALRHPTNGEIKMDRDRSFAVVEARAVSLQRDFKTCALAFVVRCRGFRDADQAAAE